MAELLEHRIRPADGEPLGALVLFHGRGVDEQDLLPVLDALDPERRLVGICPRGPLSLPPGGRHWYAVPRVGYPDPDTFLSTCARIGELLDALPDLVGASIDRTILGGFSQGAVMSYAMSLGAGRPAPASTVAMSGFIPAVEGFSLDLTARRGYRVAIAHGTHDPVISVDFARDARLRLQAAGLDVLYRESPMAHTIDPRVIPELEAFVSASLPGR